MSLLVILIILIVLSVFLFIFYKINKDKIGDEDYSSIFWILVLYARGLSFILGLIILLIIACWV